MDIDHVACQLAMKAVGKITLGDSDPTNAAEEVRGLYDEIVKRIQEYQYPVSETALHLVLSLLDKNEVVLKEPYIGLQVADAYGKCAGVEAGKKD